MPRLPNAIAVGLVAALLASCARSGPDSAPPPKGDSASAEPQLDMDANHILFAEPVQVEPAPGIPPPAAEADAAANGHVVITGARIRRPNLESAMPLTVVGSQSSYGFAPPAPPASYVGRDRFPSAVQNGFKAAAEEPVSTFSIDVDTASYSFVRASLNRNLLPQQAAVRTEEMINYFPYDYSAPRSAAQPFSSDIAVFPSPWSPGRKLVRIGIKGYSVQRTTRPRANLVFLIDTSGSMNAPNRLPLVQQSLSMLLDQLGPQDKVAIVAYAGSAGTVLEPTPASQKATIRAAIDRLGAGGSTAGAEGIRQAYALAERNRDPDGVNRVILATDGDFNVGITDPNALKGFVERERGKGVFLSVLGFGMGNYNDALMQTLAQN
jgi:Ca-activated chloride channel family protein